VRKNNTTLSWVKVINFTVCKSNKTWSFITFTHDKVLLLLHTVKFYYFHSRQSFIAFGVKTIRLCGEWKDESNTTSHCVKAVKLCREWKVENNNTSLCVKAINREVFIAFTHREVLLLSLTTKFYCFHTPWSFITFTHDKVLLLLHTVKFYYLHSKQSFIAFVSESNKTSRCVKTIKLCREWK
jgi:uncharacterized membrane protein